MSVLYASNNISVYLRDASTSRSSSCIYSENFKMKLPDFYMIVAALAVFNYADGTTNMPGSGDGSTFCQECKFYSYYAEF